MENLLDYLLYALFGHEVTKVCSYEDSVHDTLTGKSWTIRFEDRVYITLDEVDLRVIRNLYDQRNDRLDEEERARYQKIFNTCI